MWRILIDLLVLSMIFGWILFFSYMSPEDFVSSVGTNNGYVLAFFIGFFGGLVTFTFASVYPSVVALAIGGLQPIFVGLIAGLGLTIANMLFFIFGVKGRDVAAAHPRVRKFCNGILHWLEKKPKWTIPVFIWLYVGLTPLPNNLLTMSGGVINYSPRKLFIPLLFGNITLLSIITSLAVYGVSFF